MKSCLIYILILSVSIICCTGCSETAYDPITTDSPASTDVPSIQSDETAKSLPTTESGVPAHPISDDNAIEVTAENNATLGGSTSCIHTVLYGVDELDNSYHSIDSILIEYVGEENFMEWISEREAQKSTAGVCPFNHVNIVQFVEDFDIPRQVFENLNSNFLELQYDYNLDAIYGGTDIANNYYTSDRLQGILEKKTIRLFKSKLLNYIVSENSTAFSTWITEKNSDISRTASNEETLRFDGNYNQYSYIEFIDQFNIPKDVASTLYEEARAAYSSCNRVINLDHVYDDLSSASSTVSIANSNTISGTSVFEKDSSYFYLP